MVAYIGSRTDGENLKLTEKLNKPGVMVMIGAGPSCDQLADIKERSEARQKLVEEGVNIIESDVSFFYPLTFYDY